MGQSIQLPVHGMWGALMNFVKLLSVLPETSVL
jgi:hypothetical protein